MRARSVVGKWGLKKVMRACLNAINSINSFTKTLAITKAKGHEPKLYEALCVFAGPF